MRTQPIRKDEMLTRDGIIRVKSSPYTKILRLIREKIHNDVRDYGYVIIRQKLPSRKFIGIDYDLTILSNENTGYNYEVQIRTPNNRQILKNVGNTEDAVINFLKSDFENEF